MFFQLRCDLCDRGPSDAPPTPRTRAAMSAIFDGYEKDFLELNSTITRFNALIPTLQRGVPRKPGISRASARAKGPDAEPALLHGR